MTKKAALKVKAVTVTEVIKTERGVPKEAIPVTEKAAVKEKTVTVTEVMVRAVLRIE